MRIRIAEEFNIRFLGTKIKCSEIPLYKALSSGGGGGNPLYNWISNLSNFLTQVNITCVVSRANFFGFPRGLIFCSLPSSQVKNKKAFRLSGRRPLLNLVFGRTAFTLAEVLITLAIIGIVVALTIPSLIQNYKKQQTITAIKKFNTAMQQAITLSEIENGSMTTWDKKSVLLKPDGTEDFNDSGIKEEEFFNTYIAPYLKYSRFEKSYEKEEENGQIITARSKFFLADGSIVLIRNSACIDFTLDINGDKKPNTGGKDRFTFVLCQCSQDVFHDSKTHWGIYNPDLYTRDKLKELCKKENSYYCNALLEMDNWEFKNDYPLKL